MSENKSHLLFELQAEKRQGVRKGASRRLRREGYIPAIVYGGKQPPTSITLLHHKVFQASENESFYSRILTLDFKTHKEQVVLKALQRHPYKKQLLHLDLLRISADEPIEMRVPLHFDGLEISPGVKLGGGIATYHQKDILIRCLPKDLPEFITVDVSHLAINNSLHLADLSLPAGVEHADDIQSTDNNISVLSIQLVQAEEKETKPAETIVTTAKTEQKPATGQKKPEAKPAKKK